MTKKLNVLAVCGFGIGTSLILKINLEKVLKDRGVDAEVTNTDITTATSASADIIFTSNEFYIELVNKVEVPVVKISNFLDISEIDQNAMSVIERLI